MEDRVKPLRILISGAGSKIAYFVVKFIVSGEIYGPKQPIVLHLLDRAQRQQVLKDLEVELKTCGFVLLKDILVTSDAVQAYKDVQIVYLLMSVQDSSKHFKLDFFRANLKLYKRQAQILNEHADKRVKVIVCTPPINTCCLVVSKYAPNISPKSITGVIKLELNRAKAQLASQLGVPCSSVHRCVIWGNHSSTEFADVTYAMATMPDGKEVSIYSALRNDSWIKNEFIHTIQTRSFDVSFTGPGEISYEMSVAKSIIDHAYELWYGTSEWTSMIVYSRGEYDAPRGVFFSFPVTIRDGKWFIVENLFINEFARSKIELTGKELEQEKKWALTECG